MRRVLALCLAAVSSTAAFGDSPPEWTRPTEPFHIVGPIDYVGTEGIGVYLIRTSAGAIVIDAGPAQAAPIVERNIVKLGLKLSDVKILLATHAHWDHVAGMAQLKRDTGARLLASAADRGALDRGTPPSDTDYGVVRFAPVKVDGLVVDGRPVRLGNIALTPVLTPGHTPGCTSWTMQVKERGRTLSVLFPCSLSVAGNKLVGNKGYPGIVGDYRKSFARLSRIKADVVLPAHPELADVLGRARRSKEGDASAFVDPKVLPGMVSNFTAAFDQELAKQTRETRP
jgi:metallo-beta-lactamase class B